MSEARVVEVHSRLAGYGDFVNVAEAARLLEVSYNTARWAIIAGLQRGWYETGDAPRWRNMRTGAAVTTYRAIARVH